LLGKKRKERRREGVWGKRSLHHQEPFLLVKRKEPMTRAKSERVRNKGLVGEEEKPN